MRILEGTPAPLGLSLEGKKGNFALFSHNAGKVFLGIFLSGKKTPELEIPLQKKGDIWCVAVDEIPSGADYAFRCEGPSTGALPYDPIHWLIDPYAKAPNTPRGWRAPKFQDNRAHLATSPPFDWQGVTPPKIPLTDLVIYEMHVRGFTQDPSSGVPHPGTFLGLIEKIPYLKKLGVNAVELLPVFEFDETHTKAHDPKTGDIMPNYWGYNPLHFFTPMRRFASGQGPFDPKLEFQTMVRELHRNGIEVLLDVVYNHTGEDGENTVSLRGIDFPTYYMMDEQGKNRDYTGCGNTVNSNHPTVQTLILDSLRYWVKEMGVDGFRFDLASIFTRGLHGEVLADPPILQKIKQDPLLSRVKLIAESWDASGLYQVGEFPKWGPWSEWNGKYRDIVRRFIKGSEGKAGLFAAALTGSEFLYGYTKTPMSSINFITAHDGFTLRDLVSYDHKHNLANGEENRDGTNTNDSWNGGVEGPTEEPKIKALRETQMRNFLLALFTSQGIPMLVMGDEYGHTRLGNNNPYVQDTPLNWFLWNELAKHENIFEYTRSLIAFRKTNLHFRYPRFLSPNDIEWHGKDPFSPNWDPHSRFVAFTLREEPPLYIAFNAYFHSKKVTLPSGFTWRALLQTERGWDTHFLLNPGGAPLLSEEIEIPSHSALLALGMPI